MKYETETFIRTNPTGKDSIQLKEQFVIMQSNIKYIYITGT